MKNPKYQQLNLSLSGSLFGGIYERSRDSRKSQNRSYSPGALFDLFDITRPSRKKVARGKGLKFDNELTNKCKEKLKSMSLYSLASDVNVFWNLRFFHRP